MPGIALCTSCAFSILITTLGVWHDYPNFREENTGTKVKQCALANIAKK